MSKPVKTRQKLSFLMCFSKKRIYKTTSQNLWF